MELLSIILAAVVIGFAYVLEAITSFGSGILAIPFLAALIGLKTAVPVLLCVSCVFTTGIVAINYKKVLLKEYFMMIGCALPGIPFGIFLFSNMDESSLKLILGIFVFLSALHAFLVKKGVFASKREPSKVVYFIILFFGGVVQGAFATGGPLVVIYAARKIKDKTHFRATMCAVWLTLNSMLITRNFLAENIMTEKVFMVFAASVPFFIVGILVGSSLHKKVSSDTFFSMIYLILLLSGVSMALNAVFA